MYNKINKNKTNLNKINKVKKIKNDIVKMRAKRKINRQTEIKNQKNIRQKRK